MTQPRTPGKPKVVNRRNTFNLDTLEKDAEAPKPLPVILGGEEFVFNDIDDADWSEIRGIKDDEDWEEQIGIMLGEERAKEFFSKPISAWKVKELMKHLDEHFGWTARMGDQGEENASSTS